MDFNLGPLLLLDNFDEEECEKISVENVDQDREGKIKKQMSQLLSVKESLNVLMLEPTNTMVISLYFFTFKYLSTNKNSFFLAFQNKCSHQAGEHLPKIPFRSHGSMCQWCLPERRSI